jgi:hypothetical protein
MKFQLLSIQITAIVLGLMIMLLFITPAAISQWRVPESLQEPTYKISNNFGVVVKSEKRGIAEGFFVVREGKTWIRFDAQNSQRTIPVSP